MRDIYSLVAGFYPLVGNTGSIEYHTHRSSYGIAGSAASVANYYLDNESIPVQTNLPGNVTILGQTLGNRPKNISRNEEPEVLGVLSNQSVDTFLQDVYGTVTEDYKTDLREAAKTQEGLTGRSLEEMNVGGYGGSEAEARKFMRPGTTATPPDYLVKQHRGLKNVGFEVTRQRLGKAGHAFQGSVVTKLADDIKKINERSDLTEEQRYEKIKNAGLRRLKERYRSYNQIIGGVVSGIKRIDGKVKYTEFEQKLKDIRNSDPSTEAGKAARTIAYRNVKGKTTNYATNQALLHVQHNVAFLNPMFDTYIIDEGAMAEYGPVMNYSGTASKAYQFMVERIRGYVLRGIFASDSVSDLNDNAMEAMDVAEKKYSAWSTKNIVKHGQVISKGEYIKSMAGRPSGTRKLIPSVGVTQADKDFKNTIGKNLEKVAALIADKTLNDSGTLGKLQKKIQNQFSVNSLGENREVWAQPYISAMSFKEQAYGRPI